MSSSITSTVHLIIDLSILLIILRVYGSIVIIPVSWWTISKKLDQGVSLEISETEITESNAEIDQIVIEVEVFTLISHAFGYFGPSMQAQVSDIPFDYMGYAVFRFIEFKRRQ